MIDEARSFAIEAHGDQKYGPHPYQVHLDAVAALASDYGETAGVVAYLHDVVEDTTVELSAIEERFGKRVAECVSILTDEPGANRQERKRKTYRKMTEVSGELELALIVKAADRLANMLACIADGNSRLLEVYKQEHEAFTAAAYRQDLCFPLWHEMHRICRSIQHGGYNYRFWNDDGFGLIRQRSRYRELHHPEVIRRPQGWITGPPEAMDAITGMGPDLWSCGGWAREMTPQEALELAEQYGIGLFDPVA